MTGHEGGAYRVETEVPQQVPALAPQAESPPGSGAVRPQIQCASRAIRRASMRLRAPSFATMEET